MEIELKHLAGYLPYGLKIKTPSGIEILEALGDDWIFTEEKKAYHFTVKPILRPLSELTKEIEVNGEKFVPHLKLGGRPNLKDYDIKYLSKHINDMSFGLITKLLEWHFDIHGLIENNLAININTLNK